MSKSEDEQVLAAAARIAEDLSPAARRALIAIDVSSGTEREYGIKAIGRAALVARERTVDARVESYTSATGRVLDSVEAIDAEAVEVCRS